MSGYKIEFPDQNTNFPAQRNHNRSIIEISMATNDYTKETELWIGRTEGQVHELLVIGKKK